MVSHLILQLFQKYVIAKAGRTRDLRTALFNLIFQNCLFIAHLDRESMSLDLIFWVSCQLSKTFKLIFQVCHLDIQSFSIYCTFGENPGLSTNIPRFLPIIQDFQLGIPNFQLDIPRFLIYCTFGGSQKSWIIRWKSWNFNRESWNIKHILIILEYQPKIFEYR